MRKTAGVPKGYVSERTLNPDAAIPVHPSPPNLFLPGQQNGRHHFITDAKRLSNPWGHLSDVCALRTSVAKSAQRFTPNAVSEVPRMRNPARVMGDALEIDHG